MNEVELTPTQTFVKSMFKDRDGSPIILTPGQDELFEAVSCKLFPRMHVMNHTRWGKSLVISLAVLSRLPLYPEKWTLIAGTKEKAKIIMNYLISHIFDNNITKQSFMPDKGESKGDIRRHMNKSKLNFVVGKDQNGNDLLSEVSVLGAGDALGEGSENVIEDEAALISDDNHSLVMRMLGDHPDNNFLCKIGNPFTRGHFLKSYMDPAYRNFVLNCYASLIDGRMNWETIRENQVYTSFSVLFECLFPSQKDVDKSGWQYLFNDALIQQAQQLVVSPHGTRRLGIDVQRGGRNYNVYTLRMANRAIVLQKSRENDTDIVADNGIQLAKDNNVTANEIYVDAGGVGGGVVDSMKHKGWTVNGILFGEKAEDSKYYNQRAEMYDKAAIWLRQGGSLAPFPDWPELMTIKHRQTSNDRMLIKSKDDMRKDGEESPDVADSFALTFAKSQIVHYNISQQSNTAPLSPYNVITGGLKPYIPGIG